MHTATLTNQQARRFLLSHHGLGSGYIFTGKEGVLAYIRRVGCIQYDPLNIVGRNPELVLQSRIPDFRVSMLQELLYSDRLLVDGMDKVMSLYPTEDWPYFQRLRNAAVQSYSTLPSLQQAIPPIRDALQSRGPLSSGDLDFNEKVNWGWASARLASAVLESLYLRGELIVHHKKNNRKVYDFAHRHLTPELLLSEDPNETDERYLDWRVLRRIGGVGLLWEKAGDAWIGISGLKARQRNEAFERLRGDHRIIRLQVEGCGVPFYARSEDFERAAEDIANPAALNRASILAPLDNLLWDRRLIKELFGFEYTWEVYKPVEKRNYGYYVLPILYGDTFAARFEPGRDKRSGALLIKNWWWEPGIERRPELTAELQRCFARFMLFLGTDRMEIEPGLAEREGIEQLLPSS